MYNIHLLIISATIVASLLPLKKNIKEDSAIKKIYIKENN
jgi:hypothetical protein